MSAPQKDGLEALEAWLRESLAARPPYLIDSEGETPIDGYAEEIIREILIRVERLRSLTEKPGEQRIEGWVPNWDLDEETRGSYAEVYYKHPGQFDGNKWKRATLLIHGAPPEQSEK